QTRGRRNPGGAPAPPKGGSVLRLPMPVDAERDHIQGAIDARLSLVEYGDFQCPACGQAYHELAEVRRRMRDEMHFVFRHFPLSQVHPQAVPAAETAEAAATER